jgi:two-component system, OmpR family, sensor histidine kinase KdpD
MASRPQPPHAVTAYVVAAVAVAVVAWLTFALLPFLGLTSGALLFLLPVLLMAARGRLGPSLFAALAGAAAYNFFLLPPRFTFRIHAPDNLVSVFVLIAVAIVTSRLATRLHAREGEALARAQANQDQAELAALIAGAEYDQAVDLALAWLEPRFGPVRIIARDALLAAEPGFTALDLSAAAWAMHNADHTGHGSPIMSAADWTFVPITPGGHRDSGLLAVARPADGSVRNDAGLAQLHDHAALIGQALDRAALEVARQERERLEQLDRLRQSLLAALAHDFRTPLTVITGQLANLSSQPPDARVQIGEALAAASRLNRTMDDLIGAARLEQGALVPQLGTIDLVDVVTDAIAALHLPGDMALERAVPADLPFVLGDPVLLGHIIANLVDNAVRHASTKVLVGAEDAGDVIALTVSNDGPGIAPSQRERIFHRFTRIEGGDRTQGSGLGLAIVRGFADAMTMTVTVTASPSGGACFTVLMPVAEPTGPDQ